MPPKYKKNNSEITNFMGRIINEIIDKYHLQISILIISIIPFIMGLVIGLVILQYGISDPPDIKQYLTLVEVFRGNSSFEDVDSPFRNRILVPMFASVLPFDAITSMKIINFIFCIASGFIIFKYLKSLRFSDSTSLLGVALFTFSYPYMRDGTLALTDISAMFFIVLSLYLIKKNNIFLAITAISVGVLAREIVIITLPVYYIYYRHLSIKRESLWKLSLGIVPVIVMMGERMLISTTVTDVNVGYVWKPGLDVIFLNISNLVTYHSVYFIIIWSSILVFVPFLVTFYLTRDKVANIWKQELRFCYIAGIFLFLIPLYGFLAATFSGRFIWALYPVLIPLSLMAYTCWNDLPQLKGLKSNIDRVIDKFGYARQSIRKKI